MAAGLGFKDFTTGEVLTAADVDGYLMQGIWVFASAAARTSAVPSPQEGNYSYLKDTNSTEYYTGSAWVSAGGAGGDFVLIKTVTIGSGVSSVAVTGAFSTTYKKYKIIFNGGAASATSDGFLQFGSTTTGYYTSFIYSGYGAATVTGASTSNGTNTATAIAFSANGINGEVIVYNPFETQRTGYQFQSSTMATTGNRWNGGGYLNDATSYTDFTLLCQGAVTLTGGNISVYGFKE